MLHIALCDDNPASIEILEKYFDILNDSTIDYDVYGLMSRKSTN